MSDAHNLRSEAEILARQSRPQRNSTWVPRKRDWRYATGVYQHEDFDDEPYSRSVWDRLDHYYQAGGREIEAARRRHGSFSTTGSELSGIESTNVLHTPKSAVSTLSIGSAKRAIHTLTTYKPMILRREPWAQVTRLNPSKGALEDEEEAGYEVVGLVIRLRFTGRNKTKLQEILEQPAQSQKLSSGVHQNMTPPASSPNTPAMARTAQTIHIPHKLDSIESLYTFPLFKRTWVDETYEFGINTVRAKLRPFGMKVEALGEHFTWYADAVSVDALFPPGVPLSAKEISAFYPHHVRWKGVMVRLTNNGYRGADIMGMQAHFRGAPSDDTTFGDMSRYQRDLVKTAIPGFKTSSYKGKSTRKLRTDDLVPGPTVERRGHTLPTFDDVLRGLQRLPSGLDARGLTQCLSWYMNNRDTFTPKLELNVLHTQSLIRALREPLKPFGPQNLDRNALEEWREKGTIESVELEEKSHNYKGVTIGSNEDRRTQLHLNLDEEDVFMNLNLSVRHILLLPYLAIFHGMRSTALKMGIQKAENSRAARKGEARKRGLEAKWAAEKEDLVKEELSQVDNPVAEPPVAESQQPYRIPKRPVPVEADVLSVHKKPTIPTGPRNPFVPRRLAPAPPRPLLSAAPPRLDYTANANLRWVAPRTASAYIPPHQSSVNEAPDQLPQQQVQQMQPSLYSSQVYQIWQTEPYSSVPRESSSSYSSGEAFSHIEQHPRREYEHDQDAPREHAYAREHTYAREHEHYHYLRREHEYDHYAPQDHEYLRREHEHNRSAPREHKYDQYGNAVRR